MTTEKVFGFKEKEASLWINIEEEDYDLKLTTNPTEATEYHIEKKNLVPVVSLEWLKRKCCKLATDEDEEAAYNKLITEAEKEAVKEAKKNK